ncbi:MAG: peptide-binding protein [Deltaproteobacteria bacterium]|nr:peptide-binding protein [Deltaproteobacteria bacterium]MBW2017796.1 peptide-binding protein [Deltaproteobacteria bacterium]MBW2128036.1 peptide-binding protein [Deltaproteobacteria bacterium]MBW2305037.1 peptide-binding protein [Deltaproteobacteria bacterium]
MKPLNKTIGKIFLIIILVATQLVTMAGSGNARVEEVRIADSKGDWGYPNPFRHYPRGPGYVRMSWVFDTLIWKDRKGYVPALAKSWVYDPKERAFIFDLQEGVKWHDGKPFTSEDVVFTVNYYKKHPYSWVPTDTIAGAEARGSYRVALILARPFAPFLANVAGTMPILPKHIWEKVDDPNAYNDPKAFVGSGPYKFVDFNKAKGTYLFQAFDDYCQGVPKAKRLIYVRAGKPLISLCTGKVDLANIKPEMAEPLKKKGLVILKNDRGWNKKLMINHRIEPFKEKRFRQALAYAIDQQQIIEKAHRGFGSPASFGLLSPDHEYYNPKTPVYPHDPDRARRILESLGYRKGPSGYYQKDGKPLRIELLASNITVGGDSVPDRDGEVLKHQFEAVGIQVDLVNMEQATTDGRVRKWEFELAISGHGGLLGDAMILERMIDPETSSGSVNSARYDGSKKLLELVRAQVREMDPERRRRLVYQCQEIYAEELPAIPLYYPDSLSAYNPQKGIEWYYTKGGLAVGIPIPQNKMSLIR